MLGTIKKILDRSLELLVIIVVGVLVMDVLWQVFTRYVLNDSSEWTEELATFLMIWVSLLGAAVALNRGAHLGIDYFMSKLAPRKRVYTETLVFVCIFLFSLCVMVIGGVALVSNTLVRGQVSPALGLKMGYVYLAVPMSGFFLVVYSFIGFVERVKELVQGKVDPELHITESAAEID